MVRVTTHATPGATDAEADAAQGRVYNVAGQDWDEVVAAGEEDRSENELIVVNMGPQHPSTHGVLRLILTLDGETVREIRASIGYLHTGIEKNLEYRTWTQGTTFVTRADYLMPMFNEAAYCMAVERLLGIEDKLPERAMLIRVLLLELNRIASHLGGIGPFGLELGATTIFLQGVRMRENVLDLFELITGLRMNHAFIRPGGVAQDLPGRRHRGDPRLPAQGAADGSHDLRTLIDANPVFKARTKGIAYLDLKGCMALSVTGPILRATGLPWDLRKSQPYLRLRDLRVRRPDHRYLRRLRPVPHPDAGDGAVDAHHRAVPGPAGRPREHAERPVADPGRQDRLARPAVARPGRPRPVARAHRAHHGPVHGGAHPSLQAGDRGLPGAGGQVYVPIESPKGELGCHVVSDGGTRPYRAHLRDPSFHHLQAVSPDVRRRQPRGRDPGDRVDRPGDWRG